MEKLASIAVFCDFENLAIGAKEAKFQSLDMPLILERVLAKGKVVYKKAYSDWERYKESRKALHEAGFELVEIPHVSYSGKNSADIRMVVDALDLCYTKNHVDMFVILSGDSDFSPLVNKLRENNKTVLGVGVRHSTSNLLVENCDEFIYYDDLVKKKSRPKKSTAKKPKQAQKKDEKDDKSDKREEAIELVLTTIEAVIDDGEGTLWGPTVRRAIKRKRPNFSENYYGFKNFNEILEEAAEQGAIKIVQDKNTGHYAIISINRN